MVLKSCLDAVLAVTSFWAIQTNLGDTYSNKMVVQANWLFKNMSNAIKPGRPRPVFARPGGLSLPNLAKGTLDSEANARPTSDQHPTNIRPTFPTDVANVGPFWPTTDQRPTNIRPTSDQHPTNIRPTSDQHSTNIRPTSDQHDVGRHDQHRGANAPICYGKLYN